MRWRFSWLKIGLLALPLTSASAETLEAPTVHPPLDQYYACAEHWEGQFKTLGDALGTDCFIERLVAEEGRSWLRAFSGNGSKNEDWFGWHAKVLAPISGVVERINVNPKTNSPGVMGEGPASFIVIKANDGLQAILAHVDEIKVKVKDRVEAGQWIASIGNNGQARHPHIHIGLWKNDSPLQVRFNQKQIPLLR